MPAEKRKASPVADDANNEPVKRVFYQADTEAAAAPSEPEPAAPAPAEEPAPASEDVPTSAYKDRLERMKKLRERAAEGRKANLAAAKAEAHKSSVDPDLMYRLNRKKNIAEDKLEKLDAEAKGEDYERKRAWDYTVEESERWDKRMDKKQRHRQDVAFQDYSQNARKVYKRQLRGLQPDMAGYEKSKREAVDKAAQSGGLDIVETEDGELIAIDKDGSFYSTADSTDFVHHKADKESIDRLVKEIQAAEDARLKARRQRGINDDDGDITYINQKNKQFNDKLARFYNKYTSDIRESFERGTAM
ncbi:pre-mRNA-splicing factor syf2 [Saccharata proteae CBS 121410]|uniref:Pre-mRNA-splicing factor SYF2 n=1 Tax=Saccharata proteae CBS 121410 TaxID=1314787 RepID=A0A9P4HVE7_9PEZI|nr:pre-mRNA-splicing factor syf2 [Saccharata proteae CBS 121410]